MTNLSKLFVYCLAALVGVKAEEAHGYRVSPIKMHYFDAYGRAESMRMLLEHAGANWEDNVLAGESFAAFKEAGHAEFSQLPVLEMEGRFYAQSTAALRLLGNKFGYYSADPYQAWEIDSMVEHALDFQTGLWRIKYAPNDDAKTAARENMFGEGAYLHKWLRGTEQRLVRNGNSGHVCGSSQTIADFALFSAFSSTALNNMSDFQKDISEHIDKYPNVKTYVEKQIEENAKRMDGRKKLAG